VLHRLSETGLLTNLEDGRQMIDLDSAQWFEILAEVASSISYITFW
jgi:hypothetical protein